MTRPETKKSWNKPELIVLVRGGSEEAVLLACKYDGQGGSVIHQWSCQADQCLGVCDTWASSWPSYPSLLYTKWGVYISQ